MKAQPGSSCYVNYTEPLVPGDPIVFRRLYLCPKPLMEGFYAGFRMVIGLDGCHTKGFYKQQILTAVGLDINNGFYPLTWAVVEKENYETWRWFIECLISDLKIRNQEKCVIISDKQNGLEQVIHDLLPGTADFKRAMKKLKDFNENAHTWMIEHAESMDKSLITMLELTRSKVMKMIKDRLAAMSKKSGSLCIKIKKILDDNSKRREKAKNGETSSVADPVEGAADPVKQALNVALSEETEYPFVERRRDIDVRRGRGVDAIRGGRRTGFRAPRPAPIAWADHNEDDGIIEILSLPEQPQNDDNDVEILKVVQDTTIDPTVSQRETRRAKRAMLDYMTTLEGGE
ncbi:hypothetical protein LIER_14670 [Lithospermum erythrorhizon]|uniref:MULE transposase domain-containing protein n=1 Tax=Lithospermum erythrorhizon TaxID=34254 RepID=A0AAV3Q039_LITER